MSPGDLVPFYRFHTFDQALEEGALFARNFAWSCTCRPSPRQMCHGLFWAGAIRERVWSRRGQGPEIWYAALQVLQEQLNAMNAVPVTDKCAQQAGWCMKYITDNLSWTYLSLVLRIDEYMDLPMTTDCKNIHLETQQFSRTSATSP